MLECTKKEKILLLMTILVQKSLPLMVFRRLAEKGFDVHVSYYHDASGVYTPDHAIDFAARGRLHDLRGVHLNLYLDCISNIIQKNSIDVLVQNGCEPAYPLIPQLKMRFPHLRVVDILYNTIGHTVSHFVYENAIDGVFVESNVMEQYIRDNTRIDNRKIWINENGVDIEYLKPNNYDRQSNNDFVVGYIGRMSPEKNPLGFITLAESLCENVSNLKFRMFGDGGQAKEVQERISHSIYSNNFKIDGFVDDVRSALKTVDVIVVPSIFDGRPNIVMEANACGVPVIGAPVGAIPEMIVDGKNGYLCDPKNTEFILDKLLPWINDPFLHKTARQNARAVAEEHFSNESMFDRYANSISSLVA